MSVSEDLTRRAALLYGNAIYPACRVLSGVSHQTREQIDTHQSRAALLATAMRSTRIMDRRNYSAGFRRGFWGMEQHHIAALLRAPATGDIARAACHALLVEAHPEQVWLALEHNDTLAAVFARLALWGQRTPGHDTNADTAWGELPELLRGAGEPGDLWAGLWTLSWNLAHRSR